MTEKLHRRPPRRHPEGSAAQHRRHHLPGRRRRRGRHPPARLLAAATGDIYVDGMRDPAFYERDAFNFDRVELLRGSASMLFGRGSTGGVVNQVSKQPGCDEQRGRSHARQRRLPARSPATSTCSTARRAALRINAMTTHADNHGNRIDKHGIAPSLRWGIGTRRRVHARALLPATTTTASTTACRGCARARRRRRRRGLVPVDPRTTTARPATTTPAPPATRRFSHTAPLRRRRRRAGDRAAPRRLRRATSAPARSASAPTPTPRQRRRSSPRRRWTIGDGTLLNRGTNNKVQDLHDHLPAERLQRTASRGSAWATSCWPASTWRTSSSSNYTACRAQPALDKNKPRPPSARPTTARSVDESRAHAARSARDFDAKALGVYAQDLIAGGADLEAARRPALGPLRAALRDAPATATAPDTVRSRSDSLWSKRFGVLYQPTRRRRRSTSRTAPRSTPRATPTSTTTRPRTRRPRAATTSSSAPSSTAVDGRLTTRAGGLPHHQVQRAQPRLADSAADAEPAVGPAPRHRPRARPCRPHHAGMGGVRLLRLDSGARIDIGAPGVDAERGEGAGSARR